MAIVERHAGRITGGIEAQAGRGGPAVRPVRRRGPHRPGRAACAALLAMALVFVAGAGTPAQTDVTDAQLESASAGRRLRVGSVPDGRVTTIPIEVYISRVLAGEAEPRAPEAELEALAIAIRTYAAFNDGRHRSEGFDLCDSTHCQVQRAANAATRRAALATAGQILTFEGRPAELFYSASCGGYSENASDVWPGTTVPYLRAEPDDVHDEDVPWTVEFTWEQIQRALERTGLRGSRLAAIAVEGRSRSGRVTTLKVEGMEPASVGGYQFRLAVGPTALRSTSFTLAPTATGVQFTGRGYGHGVGMCVVGAGRRARRGETVAQILAHYYPGLVLTTRRARR